MPTTTKDKTNNTLKRPSKFAGMFGKHSCYLWLSPANFSTMYEDKLKQVFDLSMKTNYFITATDSELKQVQKVIQYPHPTKHYWGIKINVATVSQADKFQKILLSDKFNWEFCVVFISASNYKLYLRLNKLITALLKRKLSCYSMSFSFINKGDVLPLVKSFFKDIEKPALIHLLSIRNNAELVYECLRACSDMEVLTLEMVSPFKDTSASFNKFISTLVDGELIPTKVRVARFIKQISKLKAEYGIRGLRSRVNRQMKDILDIKHLEVQGVISRYIEFDMDKIREQHSHLGNLTNYKARLCLRWGENLTLKEITHIYTSLILANSEEECLSTWFKIATRLNKQIVSSKGVIKD